LDHPQIPVRNDLRLVWNLPRHLFAALQFILRVPLCGFKSDADGITALQAVTNATQPTMLDLRPIPLVMLKTLHHLEHRMVKHLRMPTRTSNPQHNTGALMELLGQDRHLQPLLHLDMIEILLNDQLTYRLLDQPQVPWPAMLVSSLECLERHQLDLQWAKVVHMMRHYPLSQLAGVDSWKKICLVSSRRKRHISTSILMRLS
jgi:hypothetical protein